MANEVILVIEDDAIIARTMKIVLGASGYTIIHKADGDDGLAALRADQSRISLVITDISLPTISGIDVLNAAVSHFPKIKFMAISGSQASLSEAKAAGAHATLEKPFSSGDLVDLIESLLAEGQP